MLQIGDTFQDGGAVFKVKKFGGSDGALIGSVTWYAGAGTPENYLLCDGSAVSRTDYAALFAVIGTTYGAGNGSTTFNLPLLTDGRFVEGSGTPGQYIAPGLPNHQHIVSVAIAGSNADNGDPGSYYLTTSAEYNGTRYLSGSTTSITGFNTSTTVQPTALTLRPIIKYI